MNTLITLQILDRWAESKVTLFELRKSLILSDADNCIFVQTDTQYARIDGRCNRIKENLFIIRQYKKKKSDIFSLYFQSANAGWYFRDRGYR